MIDVAAEAGGVAMAERHLRISLFVAPKMRQRPGSVGRSRSGAFVRCNRPRRHRAGVGSNQAGRIGCRKRRLLGRPRSRNTINRILAPAAFAFRSTVAVSFSAGIFMLRAARQAWRLGRASSPQSRPAAGRRQVLLELQPIEDQ